MLPYGPRGWLVELPADDVVGLRRAVDARRRSRCHRAGAGGADRARAARRVPPVGDGVAAMAGDGEPDARGPTVPASSRSRALRRRGPRRHGPACGLTPDEVIDRHTAAGYDCAFCGFAPGFAYLRGLDPVLRLPRRAAPHARTGRVRRHRRHLRRVYPCASPGGWHLLGPTDARLWDTDRERPPDPPGTTVRFVVVGRSTRRDGAGREKAGWATSIQDGGRPGHGPIGVPGQRRAGRAAAAVLNRLVGNPADHAVIETLGRLEVATSGPAVVATSADLAPRTVGPHDVVAVDPAAGALWGYLAVRGSLDVRPVLGSRSTETALRTRAGGAGRRCPAADRRRPGDGDRGRFWRQRADGADRPIGIHRGPRAEWFTTTAHELLGSSTWTVSSRGQPGRRPPRRPGAGTFAGTVSCRAKGCCRVPSRSHQTVAPSSCSPTTRRPAGIP